MNYTIRYKKTEDDSYIGQIIEWPQVVSEGKTIEECKEMLMDALQLMIEDCIESGDEIPVGGGFFEQISIEPDVANVR